MNAGGRSVYKFFGVHSSSRERSSRDSSSSEKRVCTVFVNYQAANEEKQNIRRNMISFRNSHDKASSVVLNLPLENMAYHKNKLNET